MVTNQKLERCQLAQRDRQVHSSVACTIQLSHTGHDGDTLFAVTTSEEENPQTTTPALGVLAAELAWDAMLNRFKE